MNSKRGDITHLSELPKLVPINHPKLIDVELHMGDEDFL